MKTASVRAQCAVLLALPFILAIASACQHDKAPAPHAQESTPASMATPAPAVVGGASPIAELAALDARVPVPLQPIMAWHQKQNMMAHLVAIRQITDGLAREDWQSVMDASKKLGSSPQMEQMCQHMGAGAEGFTEAALDFHRRADAIGAAAQKRDTSEVLRATSHTLQACTSCHAIFKQDVVDPATWQARTGSGHSAPTHAGDP